MKYFYNTRLLVAISFLLLSVVGIYAIFYPVKIFDIQFLSVFQRVFIDFSLLSLLLLLFIIVLTLLFGRLYCSLFCPLGIMQEILCFLFQKYAKNGYIRNYSAKYFLAVLVFGAFVTSGVLLLKYIEPYAIFGSAFTLTLSGILIFLTFIKKDICVSCALCENKCQSACINSKEKSVDNETCVKCFQCLQTCPRGAISYGIKPFETDKINLNRRKLVTSVAAFTLFGAMCKFGLVFKTKLMQKFKEVVLPPGAQSEERLINTCFNCNLCVENCPTKIIVKADKNFPAIHIDYTKGYCEKNCNKCSEVCPSGAIKRLEKDQKQRTRIAMATINGEKCVKCAICVRACPYNAVLKIENKIVIDSSKCIGCATCKSFCPHDAIEIFAVKKQNLI